ncbi:MULTISPECIES: chemotaxis protein [Exiguobacterium]|jgi:two-component system chemotaxis response regulator CheV|uniref:Hisitidine kinase n=2 Tax=Exiguobacterium TaxID=33986 RepID=U1LHY7_9BACL|nr:MULTISPECIES: chemotaxis protein [Exiguobacterium]ERG67023.1 hisitidine kinase [Exiguobacterium chiriqhucha RW-2]MDL5377272.1 chemotaxis protein [Exiguobacterium mexicanum]TCI72534.1 chemotaxis signal transduction protein CheV [Exiguobacterium sp. IPCI3]TCI81933.1 chemotaxis signal transduction protein CheV [Exiguobacterium sp. IPCH1]TCI83438.1 chemotaxis signal transduction protein CheV [Exiguobacterium sp. IPBC4]
MDHNILLEAGTNELEIVIFQSGPFIFGINVMKVREIITMLPLTPLPGTPEAIMGLIELRGEVMTVIDLPMVIGHPRDVGDNDRLIVCEFNGEKSVLRVDQVTEIKRISWEQIDTPSDLARGMQGITNGVVKTGDQMIILLDYERIALELSRKDIMARESVKRLGARERSNKHVWIAEDSEMLRTLIIDTLDDAGYFNTTIFNNGKEALDAFEQSDVHCDLLITDIEMPQMDGLHLTKRLREMDRFADLPIIIFSSLISDDLKHKGDAVGANAQITKPEIGMLIATLDEFLA